MARSADSPRSWTDQHWDGLYLGATLATLAGDDGYGLVEDAALGWNGERIVFAGPRAQLPAGSVESAGEVLSLIHI